MSLPPGVLSVTVEFAKDLKERDWVGRQDPYCIVRVGNRTFRTRTAVDGGRNPVWDETFEFNVGNENDLEIDIMDNEMIGRDEPLGTASCTLAEVRLAGSHRMELPVLNRRSRHQHGILCVSLRWDPAGAPAYAAGGYEYCQPGMMAGGTGPCGMYIPPEQVPYGVEPSYGVPLPPPPEVGMVEIVRPGEYPTRDHHHHHHHHHGGEEVEEVVVVERIE